MKPLLRSVSTIADAHLGSRVTLRLPETTWEGRLIAVVPRSTSVRLRLELEGGAELFTGWLDAGTPVEIHREAS